MNRFSRIFLSGITGLSLTLVVGLARAQVASELEAVNEGEVLDIATDELLLNLSLTNTTETDLLFLGYQTPQEGFENDLFVVERNGKRIEYIGKLVFRTPPTRDDWIRLEPGETLSMVFDLATAYDITEPGVYTVRYRGVQSVPDTAAANLSKHHAATRVRSESNTVSLQVTGSRLAAPRPANSGPSTGYYECTRARLERVYATEREVGPAADAAAQTARNDPGFVTTWFGSASFAGRVADHFSCISGRSQGNQYFCDTCGSGVVAYTYRGGGPIWLCELYFSGGYGAGVLLHEVSHHCGTGDNGYGCGTALRLARTDPFAAVDNADNYRCASGLGL